MTKPFGHRQYLSTKSSLISSRVLIREKLRFHREWLHGDCANAHRATRAAHEARSGLRHTAGIAIATSCLGAVEGRDADRFPAGTVRAVGAIPARDFAISKGRG
jgi:hypothetical protein